MPEERQDNDGAGPVANRHFGVGRTGLLGLGVVALLVGGTALGLAVHDNGQGGATATSCGSGASRLTVLGTGTQMATPDVLNAVLAVNSTAPTASAALNQNNDKVAAVIFALTQHGTAKKDIQTAGLSLQEQFAYPKGVPTVTGWQAATTVTASLRHTTTAGAAVDAVVGASGNAVTINALTFSFSNPSKVEDQARAGAVRQAVSRAGAMAQAAGRDLGPLCSLTDSTPSALMPQPFFNGDALSGGTVAAAAPTAGVPLAAGSQSESDQVTLVYSLGSPSGRPR